MTDDTLAVVLERLLSEVSTLCVQVADLVHREQASYSTVSDGALALAVRRNMETATRVLRSGKADPSDDLLQVSETIRERFSAGIPMEEAVRAFGLCIWQIHQRFLDLSSEEGLEQQEVLSGSDLLWRLGDAITARVVLVYRELSLQESLADAQRRADMVRRLLLGMSSEADLQELKFDLERPYAALRGCAVAGERLSPTMQVALETSGSLPLSRAILATINGECVGVVAREPKPQEGVLVAVGPMMRLAQINESWRAADLVCQTALHRGLTGVFRLEDLTWQVAAVSRPEVTRILVERVLTPLRELADFGLELEDTVRCYLTEGMSIPRTAGALNLHANTVRHRLQRFTELTGIHLDDPGDLVEAVWALEMGNLVQRPARL